MKSSKPDSHPGTPNQRLASAILRQDVQAFIAERRANGRPWRLIERDLRDATAGQIDVTHETLRSWHNKATS